MQNKYFHETEVIHEMKWKVAAEELMTKNQRTIIITENEKKNEKWRYKGRILFLHMSEI